MRLKSTATWLDLGGIEAAYQPIGAPSAVDALMNVGHTDALGSHRMAGRYTATPGTAPTWSAATGHTYNGTTQYLNTGIVPINNQAWSIIVRYTGFSKTGAYQSPICTQQGAPIIGFELGTTTDNVIYYENGFYVAGGPPPASAILGVAGNAGYKDGLRVVTISTAAGPFSNPLLLGARNGAGTPAGFFAGALPSVLVASRVLSAAEVWLASRQMAYCEQNPDWNAWARRRRYYYAPSAAAGRVGIYGRRGAVALPGGVRIGTVNDA